METESLFAIALGMVPPWRVDGITFSKEEKRLDISIGFGRGATFPCPVCGTESLVHDTSEKKWRHLNFGSSAESVDELRKARHHCHTHLTL